MVLGYSTISNFPSIYYNADKLLPNFLFSYTATGSNPRFKYNLFIIATKEDPFSVIIMKYPVNGYLHVHCVLHIAC